MMLTPRQPLRASYSLQKCFAYLRCIQRHSSWWCMHHKRQINIQDLQLKGAGLVITLRMPGLVDKDGVNADRRPRRDTPDGSRGRVPISYIHYLCPSMPRAVIKRGQTYPRGGGNRRANIIFGRGSREGNGPSVTVDKCVGASEGRPFCTITPRIADSQSSLPVPPAPARC